MSVLSGKRGLYHSKGHFSYLRGTALQREGHNPHIKSTLLLHGPRAAVGSRHSRLRGGEKGGGQRFWPQELVLAGFQEGSSIPWSIDHDFTQGLQHLSLVVIEVAIDLTDTLLLHHPQLAVGFCDESGIVANNNHSFGERRESEKERRAQLTLFGLLLPFEQTHLLCTH